jgi:hypothetical protein
MGKHKNWDSSEIFINDIGFDMSIFETDSQMNAIKLPMGLTYVSLVDDLCRLNNGKYYCRTIVENGGLI